LNEELTGGEVEDFIGLIFDVAKVEHFDEFARINVTRFLFINLAG